ncbi:acetolactate decarboxylase [Reichenbachiella carrageenanivorans]|uniref:Alpha-acetolactate decarboxylase n=1 Tax=Reichenbachiella carrageenanivorans TaxID=2979869 RepID=A0ABY6D0A7_9BACT|nr:acetolactate decarboxylase [Reichenbachiella carrageenanivorans]UXX79065.1 acetolactate decarboxylase [Reichenbachiella carrageenanivorans]
MKHTLYLVLIIGILVGLGACVQNQKEPTNIALPATEGAGAAQSDVLYHYSIWKAFVNKIFASALTAKELKTKGDLALGSYDDLDGELIMLNGILFRASENGQVNTVEDHTPIAYATAAFFETDQSFALPKINNYKQLREAIKAQMISKNIFYAFKIKGHFSKMKCGKLHKQGQPFTEGEDVLIQKRPVFVRENFKGTMVGFFCPDFVENVNVANYHLHVVSEDRAFAGHVMEVEAENLIVEMDYMYDYQLVLPRSEEFLQGNFEKELQCQK